MEGNLILTRKGKVQRNIEGKIQNDKGQLLEAGSIVQVKTANLECIGKIKKILPRAVAVEVVKGERLGQDVSGQSFTVAFTNLISLV